MLYNGRAAASPSRYKGGTSDYLCLPDNPKGSSTYRASEVGYLEGVEYEEWRSSSRRVGENMPCVVCYVPTRSAMFVQQGSYSCPSGWNREYHGFVMSEKHNHHRTSTICVDSYPGAVPGTSTNEKSGGQAWFLTVSCPYSNSELACGPYEDRRILSCAVCTK